jgi:hypothetical protein
MRMAKFLLPDKIGLFSRKFRKIAGTAALAGTLTVAPAAKAAAKDIGAIAARKVPIHTVQSVAKRSSRWRDVVDTVTKMTDKNAVVRDRAANFIYRVGVHESMGLKKVVQMGGGPARGITQVEKATASWLVKDYAVKRKGVMDVLVKSSGLSREKLVNMSQKELGQLTRDNPLFSAALTRYKIKPVMESIPEGLEAQAKYWAKHYWAGPKEEQAAQIQKFIKSNTSFRKNMRIDLGVPADVGNRAQKSMNTAVKKKMSQKNAGLVNEVLNERKINHTIIDTREKTKHLFRT